MRKSDPTPLIQTHLSFGQVMDDYRDSSDLEKRELYAILPVNFALAFTPAIPPPPTAQLRPASQSKEKTEGNAGLLGPSVDTLKTVR